MLRFLTDEDLHGPLLAALLRARPDLDIVRVQDVGLRGRPDPDVLAWAAANGRIVLSQDKRTMQPHAEQRLLAGEPMLGVFILNSSATFAEAIEAVVLANDCSEPNEWVGRIERLPLRPPR